MEDAGEAAPASAPSRTRQAVVYGLMPVLALGATVALEAGERQSLAQAVDGIQEEFGVTDFAIGLLPAAMAIVGLLASIPIGVLADRVRRTRLLAGAMVAWSGGMVLSALAPGYSSLFAGRLSVGAVEGNGPAAVSLLADYYPVRDRARMFGYYLGGGLIGTIFGLVAGGIAVSVGGWRWAFWIWIPVGIAVAVWVWRLHEPERGHQDADLALGLIGAVPLGTDDDPEHDPGDLALPPPTRSGHLDYATATLGEVARELLRLRTMWLAVLALTISQFLLLGLQFWGVEFFKRIHDLSAVGAGVFVGLFGLGAAAGVFVGGEVSDRVLARGHVNARIIVVVVASVAAPLVLVPAFLIPNLIVTTPFFIVGGLLLTVPLAPGEAVMSDVVVAPLRGRASAVRGILRSAAAFSPALIGAVSDAVGLRTALAAITPIYAVGGVMMLLAMRTYPADLAFVAAEATRLRDSE